MAAIDASATEAFAAGSYWSSTKDTGGTPAANAMLNDFTTGTPAAAAKTATHNVRCVRLHNPAVDWSEIGSIPAGFADGTDDGITSETDPTVNTLARASLACTTDQIAKFDGANWICASDDGITSETDPTVNTLAKATLSCTTDQIAKFDGTSWVCADNSALSIPAGSILAMKTCPAGWTGLGNVTAGPSSVSIDGANAQACQSPASPASVPLNSILAMKTCPAGWTGLGNVTAGPSQVLIDGANAQACQSPASPASVPPNSVLAMKTCPAGWTGLGDVMAGGETKS